MASHIHVLTAQEKQAALELQRQLEGAGPTSLPLVHTYNAPSNQKVKSSRVSASGVRQTSSRIKPGSELAKNAHIPADQQSQVSPSLAHPPDQQLQSTKPESESEIGLPVKRGLRRCQTSLGDSYHRFSLSRGNADQQRKVSSSLAYPPSQQLQSTKPEFSENAVLQVKPPVVPRCERDSYHGPSSFRNNADQGGKVSSSLARPPTQLQSSESEITDLPVLVKPPAQRRWQMSLGDSYNEYLLHNRWGKASSESNDLPVKLPPPLRRDQMSMANSFRRFLDDRASSSARSMLSPSLSYPSPSNDPLNRRNHYPRTNRDNSGALLRFPSPHGSTD